MKYLLDTNIISEIRKPKPHPQVSDWIQSVPDTSLYLSMITLGEIRTGIEKIRPSASERAKQLELWLLGLKHLYAGRILPVSESTIDRWGRLLAERRDQAIGALIAATAWENECVLVTRNVTDFTQHVPNILNPFSDKSS